MAGRNTWLSWITFIAGLWLIISPSVLGYSNVSSASNNDIIVGLVVAVFAFITAVWGRATANWLSWVIALVGLWEIAAPFILGYSSFGTPLANAIILGILIIAFSGWRALGFMAPSTREEYGPTFFSEERKREQEEEYKEDENPKES